MAVPDRKDVRTAVRAAMADAGFRKTGRGEIFVKPVASDVLAWISTGVHRDEEGILEISPNMGVRHERVHALIDACIDEPPDGTVATISRSLGYLTPHRSANLVWEFRDADLATAQAANMASAIERYGMPYVESHIRMDSLIAELEGSTPWIYGQMRIPAALALLGRKADARSFLERELRDLVDRHDPAAQFLRRFADRFLARLPSIEAVNGPEEG